MKREIITVKELSIRVVTGETCYPRENGFSSIHAEVIPQDQELASLLEDKKAKSESITLRCAMLDASGRITNIIEEEKFIMLIDDIEYRKPHRT